jgi:uncharacterized membrane protein YccF (DUF307 family)
MQEVIEYVLAQLRFKDRYLKDSEYLGLIGIVFVVALVDGLVPQRASRINSSTRVNIILGNFLWMMYGGLELGLLFIVPGIAGILTIVLRRFGFSLFQVGTYLLLPFGRQVQTEFRSTFGERICNLVWFLFVGTRIIIPYLLFKLPLIVWVITFAATMHDLRLLLLLFMPFGHTVVYYSEKFGVGE